MVGVVFLVCDIDRFREKSERSSNRVDLKYTWKVNVQTAAAAAYWRKLDRFALNSSLSLFFEMFHDPSLCGRQLLMPRGRRLIGDGS